MRISSTTYTNFFKSSYTSYYYPLFTDLQYHWEKWKHRGNVEKSWDKGFLEQDVSLKKKIALILLG